MVTVLRPLSTSELLDRTFHLYRNHFVLFVGITALPQLAVLGLRLGYAFYALPRYLEGRIAPVITVVLANFIAIEIAHAATVIAVSNLHLDRDASIGSAYSVATSSLLRVVGISLTLVVVPILIAGLIAVIVGVIAMAIALALGSGSAVHVALILLIFAIIFLLPLRWWLAWSLVVPVTVLEGGGLRTSMRRSKNLTQDSRGRILLVYLLIALLTWVVSILFQFPFFVTAGLRVFRHPATVGSFARVLQAAGAFFSASLLGPLVTVAFTLIYYDQRVRKEGFDLQLMMSTLEGGTPAPSASPSIAGTAT
jgi:hypothetical protein